jgi:hypothetical protein
VNRLYPSLFPHDDGPAIDPFHAALIWVGILVVLIGLLGLPS